MKGGAMVITIGCSFIVIFLLFLERKQINLWGEIGRRAAESAYMDFMNLFGQRGVQIAFCSIAILYP